WRAEADRRAEALQRQAGLRGQLFRDPVHARALGGDVGADVTASVADAVVGRDLERPDAVVELAGGVSALGPGPAGPGVRRTHRVVRTGENDLVDAPRTQLGIAVAGQLREPRRPRDGATAGRERYRHAAYEYAEARGGGDQTGAAARYREALVLGRRSQRRQQLARAEVQQPDTAQHDNDVDGERWPDDQQHSGKQGRASDRQATPTRARRPQPLTHSAGPFGRDVRAHDARRSGRDDRTEDR